MTYEQDFYGYLANHADGTALRSLVSTRIYWGKLPQSPTFPNLRLTSVTTEPGWVLTGDDGWQTTTIQVSVFDRLHATCVSIREALRTLLHGQAISYGSTDFKSIRFINTLEMWVDDTPGGYWHLPCDFRIMHRDS